MRLLILLSCSVFLLISCTANKPVLIDKNRFFDESPPKVDISFPFDIELISEEKGFTDTETFKKYQLDSENKEIFIYKSRFLRKNYFYLGADNATKKNPFYMNNTTNGFCSVILLSNDDDFYLEGDVTKYIGQQAYFTVRLYQNAGLVLSRDAWKEANSDVLEEFIAQTEYVCEQILE